MIPMNEKIYLNGFLIEYILKMYSIVNKIVNTHSKNLKNEPYLLKILSTLLIITINTEIRIAIRSTTSKILPPLVSASKIISCNLSFSTRKANVNYFLNIN